MGAERKSSDLFIKNHYQVLDLPQDCSFKDVRESFVKLSKQYHPDRNPGDPECHKSFLKILEAYTVLSKPQSRQLYDISLMRQNYGHTYVETNAPSGRVNEWRDDTIYSMRDRSRDAEFKNKPYYGIKGIKRVTNGTIVMGCVLFMIAGACFHYVLIKKSTAAAIDVLNRRDQESIEWYNETRKRAMNNTKEANLERLRQRFESDRKS